MKLYKALDVKWETRKAVATGSFEEFAKIIQTNNKWEKRKTINNKRDIKLKKDKKSVYGRTERIVASSGGGGGGMFFKQELGRGV